MLKKITVEIITFMIILLFLYTGMSKIIDFDDSKFQMQQSVAISQYAGLLAVALPFTELLVAVFLFMPKTKKLGLIISTILMIIFTLYVVYMLTYFSNFERPCSCGGIMKKMSWVQHLYFNITFTILCFVALYFNRTNRKIEVISDGNIIE